MSRAIRTVRGADACAKGWLSRVEAQFNVHAMQCTRNVRKALHRDYSTRSEHTRGVGSPTSYGSRWDMKVPLKPKFVTR